MIKVVENLGVEGKPPNRLSISVAVGEGESTEAEFGRVRDALLAWQKSGRAARGALEIEIQTEESGSSDVLHTFMRIVSAEDPLLHEFYGTLQGAEICTVAASGKRIKKIGFAH